MKPSSVYFQTVSSGSDWNSTAQIVLEKLISDQKLQLEPKITLKIHTDQPGNISFIKPIYMKALINYLLRQNIKLTFMETNTAGGPRSQGKNHRQIAKKHGFTIIPFLIADGEDGNDHVLVPIKNTKHFKACKIARHLYQSPQTIIISHFKGHCMTGFGGAIKMLGIGYASKRGKIEAHSVHHIPEDQTIDWKKAIKRQDPKTGKVDWNGAYVYSNLAFMQRTAEYALAATKPNDIHLVYAVNLVDNCDCDSQAMTPLYPDIGIFASSDPVAIDKAILDMIDHREGQATYWGRSIFPYAEKIGLGSQSYNLIKV